MPKTILGRELFTLEESCSLLEISVPTLRKMRREGELRSVTIGGKIYIPREVLEDFLAAGFTYSNSQSTAPAGDRLGDYKRDYKGRRE